tara:strand:- start:9073 stop:10386 length:1314 start_codon:yes stop_codon:yes gene_type:complete
MDLLVFLERDSPRVKYIFHHVFHHVLGLNIEFTQDESLFLSSSQPKLNYSKQPFADELFFYASDFIFQNNIETANLEFSTYKGIKIFFLCKNSSLPFDPFSASFFMLSRYEEYLPHNKDKIGRFDVKDSIAFKNEFLTKPVVDHWIVFVKEKLLFRFPQLSFKENKFQFINTIDVDNAYAYLEKGLLRTIGAVLKDILQFRFSSIKRRIGVLFFNKKDPYDTYRYLLSVNNKYNLKTIFFFLLGDYGFYDRNIHYTNVKLKQQIQEISNYCDIGIHSSMRSVDDHRQTAVEIERLESIINKRVTVNRQHFLFLDIPFNYRNLINAGIEYDYSMGFPTHPGFRAGTSFPFYFFDLENNTPTNLLLYPFSVMDISFNNYLNMNPIMSLELIKEIIDNVHRVNGKFISIWHNESLHNEDKWIDWNCIYEDMINYIINEKN